MSTTSMIKELEELIREEVAMSEAMAEGHVVTDSEWRACIDSQNELRHTLEQRLDTQDKLMEHCQKYINEQQITCSESCYQSDNVVINAPKFIDGVCKIVGFYQYNEEEQ